MTSGATLMTVALRAKRHLSRRGGWLAATLLVLLTACAAHSVRKPVTDGPVRFAADPRWTQTVGIHADRGARVVFGASTVRNSGSAPARLTAGLLIGDVDASAARLAEVRVMDVSHGGDLVGAALWPYEDYKRRSVPLRGYTLAPGHQAELLFVVDVARTGSWYWPTTTLRYRIGPARHQAVTATGFLVCPTSVDECAPPTA